MFWHAFGNLCESKQKNNMLKGETTTWSQLWKHMEREKREDQDLLFWN